MLTALLVFAALTAAPAPGADPAPVQMAVISTGGGNVVQEDAPKKRSESPRRSAPAAPGAAAPAPAPPAPPAAEEMKMDMDSEATPATAAMDPEATPASKPASKPAKPHHNHKH